MRPGAVRTGSRLTRRGSPVAAGHRAPRTNKDEACHCSARRCAGGEWSTGARARRCGASWTVRRPGRGTYDGGAEVSLGPAVATVSPRAHAGRDGSPSAPPRPIPRVRWTLLAAAEVQRGRGRCVLVECGDLADARRRGCVLVERGDLGALARRSRRVLVESGDLRVLLGFAHDMYPQEVDRALRSEPPVRQLPRGSPDGRFSGSPTRSETLRIRLPPDAPDPSHKSRRQA